MVTSQCEWKILERDTNTQSYYQTEKRKPTAAIKYMIYLVAIASIKRFNNYMHSLIHSSIHSCNHLFTNYFNYSIIHSRNMYSYYIIIKEIKVKHFPIPKNQ